MKLKYLVIVASFIPSRGTSIVPVYDDDLDPIERPAMFDVQVPVCWANEIPSELKILPIKESINLKSQITIYFVRHAESIWNAQKAKNKIEGNQKRRNTVENGFSDAALSSEGIKQSNALNEWIFFGNYGPEVDSHDVAVLRGLQLRDVTVMAVSNLQRAQQTASIAFFHRLWTNRKDGAVPGKDEGMQLSTEGEHSFSFVTNEERMQTVDALQEITGSADGQLDDDNDAPSDGGRYSTEICPVSESMRSLQGDVLLSPIEPQEDGTDRNRGGLHVTGTARLEAFCTWIAGQRASGKKVAILTGHSTWLQRLFQQSFGVTRWGNDLETELTRSNVKLGNASVIRFTLKMSKTFLGMGSRDKCQILANSTWMVHGTTAQSAFSPMKYLGKLVAKVW